MHNAMNPIISSVSNLTTIHKAISERSHSILTFYLH